MEVIDPPSIQSAKPLACSSASQCTLGEPPFAFLIAHSVTLFGERAKPSSYVVQEFRSLQVFLISCDAVFNIYSQCEWAFVPLFAACFLILSLPGFANHLFNASLSLLFLVSLSI